MPKEKIAKSPNIFDCSFNFSASLGHHQGLVDARSSILGICDLVVGFEMFYSLQTGVGLGAKLTFVLVQNTPFTGIFCTSGLHWTHSCSGLYTFGADYFDIFAQILICSLQGGGDWFQHIFENQRFVVRYFTSIVFKIGCTPLVFYVDIFWCTLM